MKYCDFCQEFHPSPACRGEGYLTQFPQGNRILADDGKWVLIPTVGGFTEGYTLLVAKAHRLSLHHATEEEKNAALQFIESLDNLYRKAYGCSYFMFEHGIVDESVTAPTSVNHVHLHFLPNLPAYETVASLIEENASLTAYPVSDLREISPIIEEKGIRSYLLFGTHQKYTLVDIGSAALPSQYLRAVTYRLATGKHDDGWNWKTHPEKDIMLSTFKTLEKAYDSLTATHFSKRAEAYEEESGWIRSRDFIQSMIPAPFGEKKLLDLACGTGILAENAYQMGWQVTALDNCEAMLREVDKGIETVLASAEALPFEDNSFDLSLCRQGLQYTLLPKAAEELLRVTKKEIILLHATVHPDDVALWQSVFTSLGYVGKNILASTVIQDTFAAFPEAKLTEDRVLYTHETLAIPEERLAEIKSKLLEDRAFAERNRIHFDGKLHYRLEWHLLRIET